jgi:hypothetical protein
MQAKFTRESDFRQERDFGAKIGATFEFLGAHWRPLGKCLAYFVLPVTLVLGVGLGLMTNGMWNMASQAQSAQSGNIAQQYDDTFSFAASSMGGLGVAMLGGLASFIMLMSTVYTYVRLLLAKETASLPTPSEVWVEIKHTLGRMLLAFALLIGIYLALAVVFGLLAAGLGAFVFLLIFLLFPALVYISVPFSLYFPVLLLEQSSIMGAWRRCFYLVRGHWWSTLGLLLVAGLIQSTMTILFVLPQYAVMIGKMLKIPGLDSDALGIAAQCLYAAGTVLTYPVSLLALVFQYFNLVEQKEGLGLRTLVDSIGTGPAPVAHDQAYRPDDDGEY